MNFIQSLARSRTPVVQFFLGLGFSALIMGIELLLWHWLASTPFVILPMAIIFATLMGGGLVAGFTASLTLALYSFSFPQLHKWIPQTLFLLTGVLATVVIDQVQKRIRSLAGAEARASDAQRLTFAAASAQLGIWEWDIQHDQLTWDDQMLRFYGITRESFSGRVEAWQKGIHPEDTEHANHVLKEALSGKGDFDLEFRVLHPTGEVRTIKAHGLVFRDEQGNPTKMFGLNRDISEERQTIKRLEELKAYFEAALIQSQAGIVIADAPNGLLRFVNPAALQIVNRTESELVKDVDISRYARWTINDIDGRPIPNEDLPLARAIKWGETSSKRLIFVRPNGEKRVSYCQTAPIRREDGSIMSGITVIVDVTEQHKLMEELDKAREAAEVAMKAKAKFLDIAAHELRTPVTAASLLAQLTQRQLKAGQSIDINTLNRMTVQLDRLSRLVVDLLEVSKLDRGVLALRYELTDLGELISECGATFRIQFPEREIRFIPPKTPVKLFLDPTRIYEVIANLIDNAVKYSPEYSPVELRLEDEPDYVRFSIHDYGPGLSEESQKKLFSAFERANAHDKSTGLGLGLFICRGIVTLHQGIIGVKSSLGNGCTFYFEIPKKQVLKLTGT